MEALLNGIVGSVLGTLIGVYAAWRNWIWTTRSQTERQLLSEALSIQSLLEAWQLEDEVNAPTKLTDHIQPPLPLEPDGKNPWLRNVEIRTILDAARWNYPGTTPPCYGFLNGRRAWVVRDHVLNEYSPSYSATSGPAVPCKPALLSSKGIEELCGWVEKVASARGGKWWLNQMLSDKGVQMLAPLLSALAGPDRRNAFAGRLSNRADSLLKEYRIEYLEPKLRAGRDPE
jgi:hypothetical protein